MTFETPTRLGLLDPGDRFRFSAHPLEQRHGGPVGPVHVVVRRSAVQGRVWHDRSGVVGCTVESAAVYQLRDA